MAEYIANNTMYQRTPAGVLPTSPWLALLQLARDFAVVSTTADDDPLADVPDDARHSHTVHTVYVLCNNIVKYIPFQRQTKGAMVRSIPRPTWLTTTTVLYQIFSINFRDICLGAPDRIYGIWMVLYR